MPNQLVAPSVTSQSGPFKTQMPRAQTIDGNAFAITFPVPDNTVIDGVWVVVARNHANNGDYWRGYFETTYQRFGAAAVSGSDPTVQNVRQVGGGSAYSATVTASGNNIVVTITGVAATTIDWEIAFQGQVLP